MKAGLRAIGRILKTARDDAGLSQRRLAAKSGYRQAHLSQVERGLLDLRVSTLVELARVLGQELVLVPKDRLPAVEAILADRDRQGGAPAERPLYALEDEETG